jgi:hypothetical protein
MKNRVFDTQRSAACLLRPLKAVWITPLIVLLIFSALVGCTTDPPVSPDQSTATGNGQGADLSAVITVDSYESDIFYDAGYEITMDGVRFPLPTTLNELGDDWRFEEDERKYFTFDDYYEGTDEKLQITVTRLYYKNRLMAWVHIKNLDMNNKRAGELIAISFDFDNQSEGHAEIAVNGIGLGIPVSQLEELFQGRGKRITKEQSDIYDIVVRDYHVTYEFYEYEMEELGLSEENRGCITSLNIGLNFSQEPNSSHLGGTE